MLECDVLVVGGGSSGCVLASRLSQRSSRQVILLDAGDDTPPDAIPDDIKDLFPNSTVNPRYYWPDLEASARAGEMPRRFPQARIMGGGSNITGLIALRGMPSDYDNWKRSGADGWGWEDVLVSFRRAEKDLDRSNKQDELGIYPLSRIPQDKWPAYLTAMQEAAAALNLPPIADINDQPQDGFFAVPLSQDRGGRATTARCYLTDEVRSRRNLEIISNANAIRIIFEGSRAVGVLVEHAGKTVTIRGKQVVLCSGAIHSPTLLLRSGIGPRSALSQLGIECVADRAGVGRNLQNHPYLHYAITIPRRSRVASSFRHYSVAGIRFSSAFPDCPQGDLLILASGRVSSHPFGRGLAMLTAALYTPFSRGVVELRSADHRAAPKIEFNMFDDPRDAPRMIAAARMIERLLLHPLARDTYSEAFLLPPGMGLSQFNRPWTGKLMSMAARIALESPARLRRSMIASFMRNVHWVEDRRRPDSAAVLAAVAPMGHVTGTCRIGAADDPNAVVDSHCRVMGVAGLRVVDASIMPSIPSANTNLPSIMIGEHAAASMDGEMA